MLKLEVEQRKNIGKATKRRAGGKIPAVFYGPKETATPISVSQKDFAKVWKEAGESTVVTLSGAGEDREALIHDVDLDPISYEPRHVDFYVMEKGKKVSVSIPIEFVGVAPAVKELGGVLVKVLHEIEVEALPKDLPQHLEVDVSGLRDLSGNISAADVALPNGVQLVTDAGEVIASVTAAREEVEEETEVDLDAIEVEQKGKQDDDTSAESGKEEQKE